MRRVRYREADGGRLKVAVLNPTEITKNENQRGVVQLVQEAGWIGRIHSEQKAAERGERE